MIHCLSIVRCVSFFSLFDVIPEFRFWTWWSVAGRETDGMDDSMSCILAQNVVTFVESYANKQSSLSISSRRETSLTM